MPFQIGEQMGESMDEHIVDKQRLALQFAHQVDSPMW